MTAMKRVTAARAARSGLLPPELLPLVLLALSILLVACNNSNGGSGY